MEHEDRQLRKELADANADRWHDPEGPLTDEDFSFVERNLRDWYRKALDERTEAVARAAGLSERQIDAILGRA